MTLCCEMVLVCESVNLSICSLNKKCVNDRVHFNDFTPKKKLFIIGIYAISKDVNADASFLEYDVDLDIEVSSGWLYMSKYVVLTEAQMCVFK